MFYDCPQTYSGHYNMKAEWEKISDKVNCSSFFFCAVHISPLPPTPKNIVPSEAEKNRAERKMCPRGLIDKKLTNHAFPPRHSIFGDNFFTGK